MYYISIMSKVKHSFTLQSLEIRKAGGITSRNCMSIIHLLLFQTNWTCIMVSIDYCILIMEIYRKCSSAYNKGAWWQNQSWLHQLMTINENKEIKYICTFMCIYLFSCPSVPAPQLLIFHREYLGWYIVVVYQSQLLFVLLLCINHNCYLYMPSWGPDLVNKLISISISIQ